MEILVQDLRYAMRSIARAPGFAPAVSAIGANAATVSVAEFVLLRPLPYPDPDSLLRLCEGPRTGSGWGCMNQFSPASYRDVAAMNTTLSALGAFQRASMNLVGSSEPVRVSAAPVTAEVLPLVGVPPMIGRLFEPRAAGVGAGAVVAHMRGLSALLFGVPPVDFVTISLVILICFVRNIAAAARPAWRAAAVQPMSALRAD